MPKLQEFCRAIGSEDGGKRTAFEYGGRLRHFEAFLDTKYSIKGLDSFFDGGGEGLDVYNVLGDYRMYMSENKLSTSTIRGRLNTVKTFMEYFDVPISKTKFRIKVRTPRVRYGDVEALTKETIRKILLACSSDKRLRTYCLLLAATGMRANEALSVRLRDMDWDKSKIMLRAEFTKTKKQRYVYLTKECVNHLKAWKEHRERLRRIVNPGKILRVTRPFKQDDLFFSTGRYKSLKDSRYLYPTLHTSFVELCDRSGFEARDVHGKRHMITLHSFRRFVKSTISDLGYQDYSEWFIGHAGSTYYRKTENEKLEIFKKIEPYLTFLDYSQLEAKGADLEAKNNQVESIISDLLKRMKDLEERLKTVDD